MDIKKLAPWNWFKKENGDIGHTIPVKYNNKASNSYSPNSLSIFHDEMDRLFDNFVSQFGLSPFRPGSRMLEGITGSLLKPRLDLGSTQKEYTVSVEIPGVSEKDVSLELVDDTLIIRGEKKQEKEEKSKNFYRLERSYGSFQRTLSLPEDANKDNVKADFKNGVLNITIPRMEIVGSRAKQIEIKDG
ncbi:MULTISPECIES: Hsp20/alpha crystallin family protein [Desulfobacula]|uniref:Heat shock protein, Hsp 20 family n=2 Tax=Desulfobacula TaxID=28222 RepID=K0NFX0_DESTT|nr:MULTISPECIES: Hsp20/alpha crystallin family protein [Desulfobacula]CCK79845.1 heat shock protein, Hsp 20 family [Desulfobacula toluolica Tol2]SDU20780.1 HSP20 family protein [Desulfobacula phenolica]